MFKFFSKKLKFLNHFLEPVLGYTRLVKKAKGILIVISCLIGFIIFLLPLLTSNKKEYVRANKVSEPEKISQTPTMQNPNFYGTNDNGLPYNILADTAVKINPNEVELIKIHGNIKLKDQKTLNMSSNKANYQLKDKLLFLNDTVKLIHQDGYTLNTNSAHVDLIKQNAYSDEPITITGKTFSLQGDKFKAENEDNILFTGHIKVIILPKSNI